jgi:hypothetical protein
MQPCRFRLFIAASNPAPAREGNLGHAENDRSCAACSRRRSRTIRVHWTCSFPPPQIHSPLRPCSVSHTPAGMRPDPRRYPGLGSDTGPPENLHSFPGLRFFPGPTPTAAPRSAHLRPGLETHVQGPGTNPLVCKRAEAT